MGKLNLPFSVIKMLLISLIRNTLKKEKRILCTIYFDLTSALIEKNKKEAYLCVTFSLRKMHLQCILWLKVNIPDVNEPYKLI